MATFTLVGGPCNGQIIDATALRLSPGDPVDCGGVRYIWNGGATASATSQPTAGSAPSGQVHPRQVVTAWARLMRAYGVTTPRQLRRVVAARRRMKRAVR